ncbi:hypothetical protein SAMN05660662_0318 [Blastococcus aurantiacus]|uniref:4-amino-4-deoxy-L-arabinose transferase n=1 Tax=Blastococcus aurantiacus TaxID=1550231 RepID=A0A1G7RG20_9ACTN|nr:hypothetical protein [Blastococcus aurantiacus]SDG09692.1 hypothetical protein SAMN05660662_0318 [Blastococcus aurantiacus]
MITDRTGDLAPVTPSDTLPASTPASTPAPTPAPRAGGRRLRWMATAALLVLAALPAVAGLVDLWQDRGRPFLLTGDHAFFTLVVDAVGQHEVLLGPYSRFDWYHPGPMAAWLLAGAYFLMDDAMQALPAGALLINGVSAAAAVWVVRRRAGLVAGAWALLALVLTLQTVGDGFLRDPWNPYLPVLPFLAGVLLCWTAVRGDAWALPLAVVPLSLAAQSHVGFLPPVAAVGAVLVAGLLLRGLLRWRRRPVVAVDGAPEPVRRPRRWVFAGLLAVAVGLLLWLPPIIEQLTGTPGNARVLYDHLLSQSPEQPAGVSTGLRAVADEFGKLPAHLTGHGVAPSPVLPAGWPTPAITSGIVAFVVALGVAALRRRGDVLWLGALTLALAAAGVAAVARIDGWVFAYLTQWTVVIGILAWTTVGLGLLPELAAVVRRGVAPGRRSLSPGTVIGVPVAALATAAVLVTAARVAGAEVTWSDRDGHVAELGEAVVADLTRSGLRTGADQPVVRVDMAPTTEPVIVGTVEPGAGLVLALYRAGIDVQVDEGWRIPFGERFTERPEEAGYVVTVAYADGSSPPPQPWQRVLAAEGEFEVYGGVPPVG